jgi:hypothetical protein
MLTKRIMARSPLLLLIVLAGCGEWDVDAESLAVDSAERAIVAMNGQLPADLGFASQHMDWLRLNALTTNPDAVDTMVGLRLHTDVYSADGRGEVPPNDYLITQLCDPYARQVMKRVVECALGDGTNGVPAQSVTWLDYESGQTATWHGSLGLCPDWHTAPPDAGCLERVSACVLARLNEQGKAVSISIRGWQYAGHTLPVPAGEVATHPKPDGAFFGNLFDPAQLNDISVQVESCESTTAVLSYEDTAGESPGQYRFSMPSSGGPATHRARDQIHQGFLALSGFDRVVYGSAFACWDPLANATHAIQSGRVCAGLVAGMDCAVTSVGVCSASCVPAWDAGGVRYYEQCLGTGSSPWRWPLDVYYKYSGGYPLPGSRLAAAGGTAATLDLVAAE